MKHRKALLAIIGVVAVAIVGWLIYRAYVPPREEVIKIGAILPLTGAAAEFGHYNLQTTRLAIEEFEKKYSLSIRLYVEDSKSSPKEAVSAYRKMTSLDEGIQIISCELSSVCMAIAPMVERDGRFMMAIAATPRLNEFPNILRIYPIATVEAAAFAEAIAKLGSQRILSKVVILYINDEFGVSTAEATQSELSNLGIKEIRKESYASGSDIRSIVLKHRDCDAVVLVGYGKEMGLIIREFRNYNKTALIIASPEIAFVDPLSLIALPDPNLFYLDLPDPKPEIVSLYRRRLARSPNLVDLLVWDGVHILVSSALSIRGQGKSVDTQAIRSRIAGTRFDLSVGPTQVDNSGNVLYRLTLRDSKTLEALLTNFRSSNVR